MVFFKRFRHRCEVGLVNDAVTPENVRRLVRADFHDRSPTALALSFCCNLTTGKAQHLAQADAGAERPPRLAEIAHGGAILRVMALSYLDSCCRYGAEDRANKENPRLGYRIQTLSSYL